MTEVSLDASVVEELTRLATQSWAMMNQEGETPFQLQQVATGLIRVTYVTATSLQKLAHDGESHN
eukprot:2660880-Prorocentrum_lima.AAC.1